MSDKNPKPQTNNPLHGLTLASIVTQLSEHYGWEALASRIDIRCFQSDPSIKSSLKFLRKTPWARTKVEALYLRTKFKNNKSIKPAADTVPAKPKTILKPSATVEPDIDTSAKPKPFETVIDTSHETVETSTTTAVAELAVPEATKPTIEPPLLEPQQPAIKPTREKRSFGGGKPTSDKGKRSF